MAHLVNSSESTHLLANTVNSDVTLPIQRRRSVCSSHPSLKFLCLPSKAAIIILLWTAYAGALYSLVFDLSAVLIIYWNSLHYNYTYISSMYFPLPYAVLAFVMMFYPLSGFIADVCCGRMKTIVVSLLFLFSSNILWLLGLFTGISIKQHITFDEIFNHQGLLIVIFTCIAVVTFIIGLASYQANFIQLGLDQLFEAPSQYLGLFIHYATLAFHSGSLLFLLAFPFFLCIKGNGADKERKIASIILVMTMSVVPILLLLVSCWKRHWFYSEPGRSNPYKTVYDIIKFVKNHKYPLRRSAFTYSDRYIPSRLDFAKERYGGPFTTEQVENVKTFFRILLFLFAVGPVFSMEVPQSPFLFPMFNRHILSLVQIHKHKLSKYFCTKEQAWYVILVSGSIKNILTTLIVFPVYIWVVFSFLRNKIPKLFHRLGVGIVICILGVVSLLIIDVVGHSMNKEANLNHTQCVFRSFTINNTLVTSSTLNLHWSVLIPPNLLLGIGPLLVVATTFEFISAQSPQSMKGLLVGVFFAIRGLFRLLNSIIIIPLSLKHPWAGARFLEHPPMTNCGFVYLLLTCVSGLIGLILFSVAAKKYKYRRRDEGMFRQHDVEEIYDRYLTQAAEDNTPSD